MKKLKFTSQLHFDRGQRVGILLLLGVIISLSYVYFFVSFSSERVAVDVSSPEIIRLEQELDSLKLVKLEQRKPKMYPFNPNFITSYKAYKLGITPIELDRLERYRQQDKWINSASDFKQVTQISDSVLDVISPYFKFPAWVNRSPSKKYVKKEGFHKSITLNKIDLNLATLEELQQVSGIGPKLSERILKRRQQLGGFRNNLQLFDVWGLKPEVVNRALLYFEVKSPEPIEKLNLNKASASDLATIPGVSFALGKKIWEFVRLREGVSHISELKKIEEITPSKLQLIELYLFAE